VTSSWGYVLDPYGIYDLSDEDKCSGRLYFARMPGSKVWVSFYDIPDSDITDRLFRLFNKVDEQDELSFLWE
jgi:hypothetical protein